VSEPAETAGPVEPLEADEADAGSDAAPRRRLGLVLAVAAGVLVLDQLAKWWALTALADGEVHLVGPVWFRLTYNTAGAFGLGGALVPFLSLVALGVVLYLIVTGAAGGRVAAGIATGLLLGGALGNLSDRLFRSPGLLRGAVVDFVDLRFWPVFNVADMAITCGCILFIFLPGGLRARGSRDR
jgi:signal peptidase II